MVVDNKGLKGDVVEGGVHDAHLDLASHKNCPRTAHDAHYQRAGVDGNHGTRGPAAFAKPFLLANAARCQRSEAVIYQYDSRHITGPKPLQATKSLQCV